MSVRVKVCLSKFFKDYRQEAFVNVDSNFIRVINLEEHIRKLFNIKSSIYLTIGGILIPSQESIHVIHSGDVVLVNQIATETNNGTVVSTIETEIEPKCTTDQLSETSSPKRSKRIRKRKRKQVTEGEVEIEESFRNVDETNSTLQSKQWLKKSEKLLKEISFTNDGGSSSSKINAHIRFSDSNTVIDSVTTAEPNFLQPPARVIRPSFVLTDAGSAGSTLSPINGSAKTESPNKSDWKQQLKTLRDLANDKNFANIAESIDFQEIIRNIEDEKYFITLEGEPKIYDIVGFKILKIGRNYEPGLSEWIISIVKDVDELQITMHMLAGKDETSCPDGKLSMEICEDDTHSSEILILNRSEMLNVRAFLNE